MKTLRWISFALLLCAFAPGNAQVRITLLHVNDTHSHLDAVGPKNADLTGTIGGIARAASVIGETRALDPNVLVLHAGDAFQGDLFFNQYMGVPELQFMIQLGFDAMTVGNHEFDLGPENLNNILNAAFAEASLPLLSANLDVSAVPGLGAWIQPALLKVVDGVKIGIFGLTVPGNPTTNAGPVTISENIGAIAGQQVAFLRGEGAEVVILLSHLGIYLDRIIAQNVPGIDFIIGGHDHYAFAEPVTVQNPLGSETLIFQAGEHYKYIGKLSFTVEEGVVQVDDYDLIPLDAGIPAEPSLQGIVDVLKGGIVGRYGDVYGTIIGTAERDLEKLPDPGAPWKDTPMGNLVTDAFRKATGTDVAITPTGLISEKIYAGPVVGADVFRSMSYGFDPESGFGFRLVSGTINGADLLKGLEIGLSQLGVTEDYFLQVSGMEFAYHPARPVGHRVTVGSILIGGKHFVPVKSYSITINEGVLYLLGIFGITLQNPVVHDAFEYTVVRDYITGLGAVAYAPEGRIRDQSIVLQPLHAAARREGDLQGPAVRMDGTYPNPFNPSTTIRFTVAVPSYVSLRVYNLVGQEVATLVDAHISSGSHAVQFDASHLPSGIYFTRLVAGSTVETERLILMK